MGQYLVQFRLSDQALIDQNLSQGLLAVLCLCVQSSLELIIGNDLFADQHLADTPNCGVALLAIERLGQVLRGERLGACQIASQALDTQCLLHLEAVRNLSFCERAVLDQHRPQLLLHSQSGNVFFRDENEGVGAVGLVAGNDQVSAGCVAQVGTHFSGKLLLVLELALESVRFLRPRLAATPGDRHYAFRQALLNGKAVEGYFAEAYALDLRIGLLKSDKFELKRKESQLAAFGLAIEQSDARRQTLWPLR